MSEPRIVAPEEAQEFLAGLVPSPNLSFGYVTAGRLAHTVTTEPDRIRAAVANALRQAAEESDFDYDYDWVIVRWLRERADAIENGADL